MLGLYAEAVTVHPYSQKSNLALGFSETGVQLGDEEYESDKLTIPHRDILARRFVLVPLLELEPRLTLPDGTELADALDVEVSGIGTMLNRAEEEFRIRYLALNPNQEEL